MSFRVYDKKKKKWVNEDIYMNPNGELFKVSQSLFGNNKLTFLHQDRYVFQRAIDLNDKDNNPIYIGDYLEARVADDRVVTGMVTFANELSAYVILCFDSNEFFTLGTDVCQYIKVIGNVFDESKKGKKK